jgi:hypothetical protein
LAQPGDIKAAGKVRRAGRMLVLGGVDEDERGRRELYGSESDEHGGPDGDRVGCDEQRRRESDREGNPAEPAEQ